MIKDSIRLVKNNEREGSTYVEFFVGDWSKISQHWNSDSVFLDDLIYGYVFSYCFKNSNAKFNYFGPTKYEQRDIVGLIELLNTNLNNLNLVNTYDDFVSLSNVYSISSPQSKFMDVVGDFFNINWGNDWKEFLAQLKDINSGLINIAKSCLNNKQDLWVLGV